MLAMSVHGKVKNGVIVLPRGTKLPEGADVKVETLDLLPENDPRIASILKLANQCPGRPRRIAPLQSSP
jgi:hypothetical protein